MDILVHKSKSEGRFGRDYASQSSKSIAHHQGSKIGALRARQAPDGIVEAIGADHLSDLQCVAPEWLTDQEYTKFVRKFVETARQ
jgi:hypothetical protein